MIRTSSHLLFVEVDHFANDLRKLEKDLHEAKSRKTSTIDSLTSWFRFVISCWIAHVICRKGIALFSQLFLHAVKTVLKFSKLTEKSSLPVVWLRSSVGEQLGLVSSDPMLSRARLLAFHRAQYLWYRIQVDVIATPGWFKWQDWALTVY